MGRTPNGGSGKSWLVMAALLCLRSRKDIDTNMAIGTASLPITGQASLTLFPKRLQVSSMSFIFMSFGGRWQKLGTNLPVSFRYVLCPQCYQHPRRFVTSIVILPRGDSNRLVLHALLQQLTCKLGQTPGVGDRPGAYAIGPGRLVPEKFYF